MNSFWASRGDAEQLGSARDKQVEMAAGKAGPNSLRLVPRGSAGARGNAAVLGLAGLLSMAVAVFTLSYLTRAHFAFTPKTPVVSWPESGFCLAVLVRARRSLWPALTAGIAAGNAAANYLNHALGHVIIGFAAANVVEVTVAAWILTSRRNSVCNEAGLPAHTSRGTLLNPVDGARLIAAALSGVCAAAVIVGLLAHPYGTPWLPPVRGYLFSHGLGLLLLTPLLLTFRTNGDFKVNKLRELEWLAQMIATAGLGAFLFLRQDDDQAFVLLLPLLWGAARLGPIRAMLSVVLATTIATLGSVGGHGPYAEIVSPVHRNWALQLLLVTACLTTLILALVVEVRNQATAAALARGQELDEAQQLAALGSWQWLADSRYMSFSKHMYRLCALNPADGRVTLQRWLDLVDPAAHGVLAAKLTQGRPGEYQETDIPITRADGTPAILHARASARFDARGALVEVNATCQDVTETRRDEAALTAARDLYQGVLTAVSEQAIIALDLDGLIAVWNSGAVKMFGYSSQEMLGTSPRRLHDWAEISTRSAELGRAAHESVVLADVDTASSRQWTYLARDGSRLQVMLTLTSTFNPDGTPSGVIKVATDVTAQRAAEESLRDSEQLFRLAFDSAQVGMYMASLDVANPGEIFRVNQAFCELVGLSAPQLIGMSIGELAAASEQELTSTHLGEVLTGTRNSVIREKLFRHSSGDLVTTMMSVSAVRPTIGPAYTIVLVEDITARRQAEQALTHQAMHDVLTGLPNRSVLIDRLGLALAAAHRSGERVGVLYVDLDGFKPVNDTYGHAAGDQVLIEVGHRLGAALRPGDTVARLGGDEFAIICPDVADEAALAAIAQRALHRLTSRPFTFNELASAALTASVGTALSSADSSTDQMLRDADEAMYAAKRNGHNRVENYDTSAHVRVFRSTPLLREVAAGLPRGEFILHGQPIMDLTTGRTVAVETLVRWQHPTKGLLAPGSFLDIVEASSLMIPLGERVLVESCRIAAGWSRRFGDQAPDVHVNVSARQLETGDLFALAMQALADSGLPADKLIVELTETHMPQVGDSIRTQLSQLREHGVRVAIDDLGTGYSSLTRLTELPVDILKIDLKFIQGLGQDANCDAVTRAILGLGTALDLTVVAEGVETAAQANILRDYGCQTVQGYYYSKPRSEEQLDAYLLSNPGVQSAA